MSGDIVNISLILLPTNRFNQRVQRLRFAII